MLKAKHKSNRKRNICNQNNLDIDTDKADPTISIDNKMDLYDNCTFSDCNFIPEIGDIYSICIIYQLIYFLYIQNNLLLMNFL